MKKLLSFFISLLFLVNLSFEINGQNTYDPYSTDASCPIPSLPIVGFGNSVAGYYSTGYTGEYQIFLGNASNQVNYWISNLNLHGYTPPYPHAITYKIEVVSFPFATNCFQCQGDQYTSTHGISASDDRTLVMPSNDFVYNSIDNAWERTSASIAILDAYQTAPAGTTYEYKLNRVYEGLYGVGTGGTDPSTLASRGFVSLPVDAEYSLLNPVTLLPIREFYPHSILKHTFYIHCDASPSSAPLDSFSFVLDHTRGTMRNYPFVSTNIANSFAPNHDITVFPAILSSNNWTSNFSGIDNTFITSTNVQTINYFPIPSLGNDCSNIHIPSANILDGSDPFAYAHPAPYSLVQAFLGDALGAGPPGGGLTGLPQTYVIDQPIDLTLINPSERVIYNPSDVAIDLSRPSNTTGNQTLVFPSGYVFKTVSGVYPSITQVSAADPNNMHHYPDEIIAPTTLTCDDIGNASLGEIGDGIFSYYRIKSGSTLRIEQCVGIYDVALVVEPGATLLYNSAWVTGNFTVVDHGGTIIDNYLINPGIMCKQDCYNPAMYDVTNQVISSNVTWSLGSSPDANTDGIIRIANTLFIQTGKTLTIDGSAGALHFEFGENGRIVVQKGGKLIVNGIASDPCIFTSASICQKTMWEGIQVGGDRTLPQGVIATTAQGYVSINNAKISNARKGITTGDPGNNYNSHGGIIQCNGVDFINNKIDVEFLEYQNIHPTFGEIYNLSILNNCHFIINDYLNDPRYKKQDGRPYVGEHLKLVKVKDVRIRNCSFENSATKPGGTPLFDADLRGEGIFAFESGVILSEGSYANTFKGLSDGVRCLSTGGPEFISIKGNTFQNNVHGITLEGTNLSNINLNHFEIPVHETISYSQSGYNKPVGLYLIRRTDARAGIHVQCRLQVRWSWRSREG